MPSPTEPEFLIRESDLAADGGLSDGDRARVAAVLRDGGFVLLPSDTAFSVAALLRDVTTRDRINALLDRPSAMPISLAFPALDATRRWLSPNATVRRVLDRFCPGAITVVCETAPGAIPTGVLNEAVAGENRTVGVRVPASTVERSVAGATRYPVTTVAVRDGREGPVITSLERALVVVGQGLERTDFPRWGVIDGSVLFGSHSTVVEVMADGRSVRLIRPGDIPFDDIRETVEGGHPEPAPAAAQE